MLSQEAELHPGGDTAGANLVLEEYLMREQVEETLGRQREKGQIYFRKSTRRAMDMGTRDKKEEEWAR